MKPSETKRAWTVSTRARCTLSLLLVAACEPSTAPNPFVIDAGSDAAETDGGDSDGGLSEDSGPIDDTLGGPCNDDSQCDDMLGCTIDACDPSISRCRHTPDDASCQDGIFCNGAERCDVRLGCRPGVPIVCSDGDVCTIDTCGEIDGACTHVLRDADFDGAPDGHCIANGDCDDADPKIGPQVPEVCQNSRDDDCDGMVDEGDCSAPKNDGCLDPFVIDAPGAYQLDTTAAKLDFSASCSVTNQAGARDVVAAIVIPPGPPIDLEISAKTNADVAIALLGQCGDPATEIACSASFYAQDAGRFAKVRARNIGDPVNPTALPLYVITDSGAPVIVDVAFLSPVPAPTNETCGTAIPISFNTAVIADVVDVDKDVGTVCPALTGDLLYSFELASPSNIHIYANSVDGDGQPVVSLRDTNCALPENEITCQEAESVHIFRHALDAGIYHLAVSASAPTIVSTTVIVEPPTSPLPDETCLGAPVMEPNTTLDLPFENRQDDVDVGCLSSAVDVAYRLDLPTASDVILVQRISSGDNGAISLAKPTCAMDEFLLCGLDTQSPVRTTKRNVPAGEYRVVVESLLGLPSQATAFVRKTTPAIIVPFADGCADALSIPATGGFFQGNTANATASFSAGCDQAGGSPNGARDQLLKLTLADKKRVVLDMSGSTYATLLDVRKGPDCPGVEVFQGCTVGYGTQRRSFLDLTLEAGVYFIQVDGYREESGPWFLDVRVVDPT